jgi:hypothetical protein
VTRLRGECSYDARTRLVETQRRASASCLLSASPPACPSAYPALPDPVQPPNSSLWELYTSTEGQTQTNARQSLHAISQSGCKCGEMAEGFGQCLPCEAPWGSMKVSKHKPCVGDATSSIHLPLPPRTLPRPPTRRPPTRGTGCPRPTGQGDADIARTVIGCHATRGRRIRDALNDVVSNSWQSLPLALAGVDHRDEPFAAGLMEPLDSDNAAFGITVEHSRGSRGQRRE